ncbi:MAG: hypothetical protein BroJett015_05650 [Chloroflexota bacterium]|nr:MAG: hypothetical protein BroJett015_05650 [Chloroflexota bacterium]
MSAQAVTFVIDDFDQNQAPGNLILTANAGTTIVSGTADAPGIVGGERDVVTTYNTPSSAGDVTSRVATIDGFLSHSQANGVRGRTIITWDGNDNDPNTLNPVGLGGVNLENPTNDAFILGVVSADVSSQIGITIYTNGANFSTATTVVPLGSNNSVTVVPFSSFSISGGSGADFTNVGAIVLTLNNATLAAPDLDIVIDFFLAADQNQYEDLGDLPDTYNTLRANNGPRHVVSTLILGTIIDAETDGFPSVDADGDDLNNLNDEDGVVRVGNWSDGINGGTINVTVSGASRGCLAGWIDFNNDGDFADAGEVLFFGDPVGYHVNTNMTSVVAGSNNLSFNVPNGTFTGSGGNVVLHARFRLAVDRGSDGTCYPQSVGLDEPDLNSLAIGTYLNGEIEDYVWIFSPTAVNLQHIQTTRGSVPFILMVFVVSGLALTGLGITLARRRRA